MLKVADLKMAKMKWNVTLKNQKITPFKDKNKNKERKVIHKSNKKKEK